ncbi:hypothetical protein ACROYT_G009551 [Oculina patagonica]
MAKRRSRITYAPKSRRKSTGSDRNQSASSNAQEISLKEKATGRKRKDVSLSTSQEQDPRKKGKKSGSGSSTEAQSSPNKTLKSKRTEAKSEDSPHGKERAVIKKRVFQRKTQVRKEDGIPERIRDMTVTRKTYARWKPLSLSTKKYTKQTIENTVLSVLNSVHKESKKNDVQVHLKQLSERIVKRLDNIKGPTHKGDYSKMEAESHELEDALISCNGQVEALEKELEEQRRLFEQDEQMVNSYSDQGQLEQEQTQLHPLLQTEPVNALNLPSLSQHEGDNMSTVYEIPAGLEVNGRRLAQSLAKISDQTEKLGFTNWLEAVSQTTHTSLNS